MRSSIGNLILSRKSLSLKERIKHRQKRIRPDNPNKVNRLYKDYWVGGLLNKLYLIRWLSIGEVGTWVNYL
ncbi:hypothetical protein ACFLTH_15295 [Bacteroidota bacterium]